MRFLAVLGVLALVLAGCADPATTQAAEDDDFDGLDVASREGTGTILGVVVDQAIVPVADVTVSLSGNGAQGEATTDAEGRFVFTDLEPGTYVLDAAKPGYDAVQTSAPVEADVPEPPVVKMQVTRLVSGTPFMEGLQFNGYLECAYSFVVSSTCVNDYTRLAGPVCPGGCRPELASLLDNREYVTPLGTDWQTIVLEMVWDQSLSGTSEELHMTTSFFARESTSHFFSSVDSASPMRVQLDVGVAGPGQNQEPVSPAPEGIEDFFVFMSAAGSQVAVEQEFEVFQHNFYLLPPPEGWSLVAGDSNPF